MGNKKTVYLTEEGLNDLKNELNELINEKRPANIQAIKEARSLGDYLKTLTMMLLKMNKLKLKVELRLLKRCLKM